MSIIQFFTNPRLLMQVWSSANTSGEKIDSFTAAFYNHVLEYSDPLIILVRMSKAHESRCIMCFGLMRQKCIEAISITSLFYTKIKKSGRNPT